MITVRMPYAIERATAIAMTHEAFDDLSLGHRKVLANIVRFVKIGNIFKNIFAKKSTIARMSKVSEETVYRAIKSFEGRGYLARIDQSHDNHGYFGISEITITQALADLLELTQRTAPRSTAQQIDADADQIDSGNKVTGTQCSMLVSGDGSASVMSSQANRLPSVTDAHMKNGVPLSILRKQPSEDRLQKQQKKAGAIPDDLSALKGRVSDYAIFFLMKSATAAGKRLSAVVAYCRDAVCRLSGRELVAYLKTMISREIDYVFLVRRQQQEASEAAQATDAQQAIERFMSASVGREFPVGADLLLHIETPSAMMLYRVRNGDRERLGVVQRSVALKRWPEIFGLQA